MTETVLLRSDIHPLLIARRGGNMTREVPGVCPIGDLLLAVEGIKKTDGMYQILSAIEQRHTAFHELSDRGLLFVQDIRAKDIADHMFVPEHEFDGCELWQDVCTINVSPDCSLGLLALRVYDLLFDTDLSATYRDRVGA